MTIYWDGLDDLSDGCRELLADLAGRCFDYMKAPEFSEVSISFVDRVEIQKLNREYRGVDRATDVLSFPFAEDFEWNDAVADGYMGGKPPLALGDIIICTEIAREQSDVYGHSFERELGFLLVHGMLHIAGYKHEDPADEMVMRKAQREILEGLQL